MQLANHAVHIWQANLVFSSEQLQRLAQLLSEDEQARANRFKFAHHRDRFMAARGILRTLLSRYLDQPPEQLQFSYSDRGKPCLNNPLQFNVSHSENLALYALTCDRMIGIDVEHLRPVENLEGLTQRFFSAREHDAIAQLPPEHRERSFFRYWTCKEAYLKATGEGLSELAGLEFSLSIHQPAQLIATAKNPENIQNWRLQELNLSDEFVGTVATYEPAQQLDFKHFRFEEYCNIAQLNIA